MYNLLTEPLVRVRRVSQSAIEHHSLPEILALLNDNAIDSFAALRPHQRFAWHAFLVQLAALALHRASWNDPPAKAEEWASLLRGLTSDWPDEPWCLVTPPDKPALLQAPVPSGDLTGWTAISTPDALDMLITSRNHDLKRELMVNAAPDDWLFALLTVQTMDGGLSGSYRGISRMNSDSGSRPCVTIRPGAYPGTWFSRDLRILLRKQAQIAARWGYREHGGAALLWLRPWDGKGPIYSPADLDPLFIEICRRIRLTDRNDRLVALKATNKSLVGPGFHNGMTGDPWAPINVKEEKLFTIDGRKRFRYDRMIEFLDGQTFQQSLLQNVDDSDVTEGLSLLGCAMVRGVGKTEGYHERRIPIAKKVVSLLKRGQIDEVAKAAQRRAELIGQIENDLFRRALRCLFFERLGKATKGSGDDRLSPPQQKTLNRWVDRLDGEADAEFFQHLWEEFEPDDEEVRKAVRDAWLKGMIGRAHDLLGRAADELPLPSVHHYRTRVRADDEFWSRVRWHESFKHLQWGKRDDRTESAA